MIARDELQRVQPINWMLCISKAYVCVEGHLHPITQVLTSRWVRGWSIRSRRPLNTWETTNVRVVSWFYAVRSFDASNRAPNHQPKWVCPSESKTTVLQRTCCVHVCKRIGFGKTVHKIAKNSHNDAAETLKNWVVKDVDSVKSLQRWDERLGFVWS